MQQSLSNIEWLVGSLGRRYTCEQNSQAQDAPLPPFAPPVVEWLDALSRSLMRDPQTRQYPDVVTFAFFCRKGNVQRLAEQYATDKLRLGRGLVFHIAPSNVPVNFAYSLVAGLLAGNTNVVRVSQKHFPQVDLIVKHINALREQETTVLNPTNQRIAVVRYPHESEANAYFSQICDVRVIWGGDQTIANIRRNALKPRAFDICFADRYSVAAINANEIIGLQPKELQKLTESFYNDTYLFDQNACSAPHLVLWIGSKEQVGKVQSIFWQAVYEVAKEKYQFQEVMAVDKLTALYKQAAAMPVQRAILGSMSNTDNLLVRTQINALPKNIDEFRCACGYFTEYTAENLDELATIVTDKYQTLAYYGFSREELQEFVEHNRLLGIDRIVPFGKTTDFSLTWDGMNLIERMSRVVDIL